MKANEWVPLKPSTDYRFSAKDYQFVTELCKVGYVSLLSSQVELVSKRKEVSFVDKINPNTCDGLRLPDNWLIEWIGIQSDCVKIIFSVIDIQYINND